MKKAVTVAILAEVSLSAHTGVGTMSGLMSGFSHPISGADHVLAMFAVGLWAAQSGGRALWAIPSAFVMMMVFGAFLGVESISVPFIEEGILVSVVVLGGMIAMGIKLPVVISSAIVGTFAIFHGHAHGAEIPLNTLGYEYAAGFVAATALLHIAGIGVGFAIKKVTDSRLSHIAGGIISAGGAVLAIS